MATKAKVKADVKPPRARARKVVSGLIRKAFDVFDAESTAPEGPEHLAAVAAFNAESSSIGTALFDLAREAYAVERKAA